MVVETVACARRSEATMEWTAARRKTLAGAWRRTSISNSTPGHADWPCVRPSLTVEPYAIANDLPR